jgi:hydrogenase maturation protease
MSTPHIVVLGLGNLLWADEGFGVRCAEALYARYDLPAHVEVIDGGTQGLLLLPYVEAADHLLILDAIDFGLPPGTLRAYHDDAVPAYLTAKKMSLHQTGFSEVLALADLKSALPTAITLIGVQPVELEDYGGSLSPAVRAQLPAALDMSLHTLAAWGVQASARPDDGSRLNHGSLDITRYEAERPAADSACRVGDARVLFDGEPR